MLGIKHYKVLEKINGTKDRKTKSLIDLLQQRNLDKQEYFIDSTYKDKSGKKNKLYICTLKGIKLFMDNLRNYENKSALLLWFENHADKKMDIILYNRPEIYFLDELEQVLCAMNIKSIRQYSVLPYYIDCYIHALNLAIEYDEGDHKYYTYENQELRQKNIENELKCTFIRLSDSNSNLYNIGLVMSQILKMNVA
jgi:very-short-patch-repair endonuclease|nr:MAG TPA: hydrolase [Caudoviricetes sp.]